MQYELYNDYEIMYLVSENDSSAMEFMLDKYRPLVIKNATKYFSVGLKNGYELDDLIQEGNLGLLFALKHYNQDPSTFWTFASICIERNIIKFISKLTNNKNNALSSYTEYDDELGGAYYLYDGSINTVEDMLNNKQFDNDIINFKNDLEFIDSMIFELRSGGFSYSEISNILELSEKQVDNKLCVIRKKLKKYLEMLE